MIAFYNRLNISAYNAYALEIKLEEQQSHNKKNIYRRIGFSKISNYFMNHNKIN